MTKKYEIHINLIKFNLSILIYKNPKIKIKNDQNNERKIELKTIVPSRTLH